MKNSITFDLAKAWAGGQAASRFAVGPRGEWLQRQESGFQPCNSCFVQKHIQETLAELQKAGRTDFVITPHIIRSVAYLGRNILWSMMEQKGGAVDAR